MDDLLLYEERPKNDIDIRFRKDTDFPPHFHNCLEIIYIFDGTQNFFVDNKEYDIYRGDILIIFPYQIHEFNKSRNNSILIIVDTGIFGEYNIEFKNYKPETPVIKSNELPYDFKDNILNLISLKDRTSAYSLSIIKGTITVIIGEILNKIKLIEYNNNYGDLMRRVVSYCMQNFKSPDISLKKMSGDLNISESYISHFLADKLHTGFSTYINSLRVDNACTLLQETRLSITDIAYTCGYNNLRTFNRAFRKCKQKSPTEYRNDNEGTDKNS
jgi:AraC-like DNA-binding protein